MPTTPPTLTPVPFLEAIAWARARKVILPEVYYGELQGLARSMAFSVAGLAKLDQLQGVLDGLTKAMAKGDSFRDWRERVRTGKVPLDLPPHRLENIYRTNLQGQYGRGRCEQQKRTLDARPWFMLDAVNDSRTRPSHAAMDGMTARYDDPIWEVWTPPNGYQCVLPGTRVKGNMRIGLKARYAGKVVEVHTSSGVTFSVTANHPVLTSRGWVRAHQIKKGDDLLCYLPGMEGAISPLASRQATGPSGMINHQEAPPCAEEVFEALAAQRLGTIPAAAFDLYGDAIALKSNVYVAGADGVLMDTWPAKASQLRQNIKFQGRDHLAVGARDEALHPMGAAFLGKFCQNQSQGYQALFDKRSRYAKRLRNLLGRLFRVKPLHQLIVKMRNSSLMSSFPSRLALTLHQSAVLFNGCPFQRLGLTTPTQSDTLALQPIANGLATDVKVVTDLFETFASGVAVYQGFGVVRTPAQHFDRAASTNYAGILQRARFNPVVAEQSVEKAATDVALFKQLAHGSAGQVKVDQVVSIRDFAFSGHVYDFETENGLLTANGIITSNCRCRRISLSEAQASRFQAADAKRMADNPDLARERASAQPDQGWDYDPCAEPTEGLRRAIEQRRARCGDGRLAASPMNGDLCGPALEAVLAALNPLSMEDELRARLGKDDWERFATASRAAGEVFGLTAAEGVALSAYTDRPLGDLVNATARAMSDIADVVPEDSALALWLIRAMDAALVKMPPAPGAYWRGMSVRGPFNAMQDELAYRWEDAHRPGKDVQYFGYTSLTATKGAQYPGDWQILIFTTSARDLSGFSVASENERLVPRKSVFRIGLFQGGYHVLEEVAMRKIKPNRQFSVTENMANEMRRNGLSEAAIAAVLEVLPRAIEDRAAWEAAGRPGEAEMLERVQHSTDLAFLGMPGYKRNYLLEKRHQPR